MDHLSSLGDHGQQRVVAARMEVGEVRPALLLEPIRLDHRRVEVQLHDLSGRPGSHRPGPLMEVLLHCVRLASVTGVNARRKVPTVEAAAGVTPRISAPTRPPRSALMSST